MCILQQRAEISIHALREEGDRPVTDDPHPTENFYPRPPRGGRRNAGLVSMIVPVFLSTPSARRATCAKCKNRR